MSNNDRSIEYGEITIYENIRYIAENGSHEDVDKKVMKVNKNASKIADMLGKPKRQFAGRYLSGNKCIYGTGFLVTEDEIDKIKEFDAE